MVMRLNRPLLVAINSKVNAVSTVNFPSVVSVKEWEPNLNRITHPVCIPSSTNTGELLLMFFALRKPSGVSSVPTGWTVVDEVWPSNTFPSLSLIAKISDGSEPAIVTVETVLSNIAYAHTFRINDHGLTTVTSIYTAGASNVVPVSGSVYTPSLDPLKGSRKYLMMSTYSYGDADTFVPEDGSWSVVSETFYNFQMDGKVAIKQAENSSVTALNWTSATGDGVLDNNWSSMAVIIPPAD